MTRESIDHITITCLSLESQIYSINLSSQNIVNTIILGCIGNDILSLSKFNVCFFILFAFAFTFVVLILSLHFRHSTFLVQHSSFCLLHSPCLSQYASFCIPHLSSVDCTLKFLHLTVSLCNSKFCGDGVSYQCVQCLLVCQCQ